MEKLGRQRIYKSEKPGSEGINEENKSQQPSPSKTKDGQTISSYALEDHTKPQYGLRPETKPSERKDIQSGSGTQGQVK